MYKNAQEHIFQANHHVKRILNINRNVQKISSNQNLKHAKGNRIKREIERKLELLIIFFCFTTINQF